MNRRNAGRWAVGAIAALTAGALMAMPALAQDDADSDTTPADRHEEMVERLADELDVDADEVRGVFEQLREERQAEMQVRRQERLAAAVEAGQLTQEQADVLAEIEPGQMRGFGRGGGPMGGGHGVGGGHGFGGDCPMADA